jgi:hypothetical protein
MAVAIIAAACDASGGTSMSQGAVEGHSTDPGASDHHEDHDAGTATGDHDAGTHAQVPCEAAGDHCFADEHNGVCPDNLSPVALDCVPGRICCAGVLPDAGSDHHEDAGTIEHPEDAGGTGDHPADAGGTGDHASDAGGTGDHASDAGGELADSGRR